MKLFPFLLCLCLFLFTSCYHVYYAPNTPNVSLLTEKEELRVNAGLISGLDSEFGGGDLQVAYSPANNFAVMANGFSVSRKEETSETRTESGKGTYAELGLGFYQPMDLKKRWLFEGYAGFGGGSVKSDYGNGETSRVTVNKLFLQPAIGFKFDYVELAFSPRLSYVSWKAKSVKSADEGVMRDMNYIAKNPNFLTLEPALILRAGHKNVKAQLGLTLGGSDVDEYWYSAPRESAVGYLGISFNFSTKQKPVAKPTGLEGR